ncbi:hypothetical protein N0V83_008872 [Neocucurbitaria cava]|uniref:Uncharacterized protein n=1 Tax=Neocucurbitaria cava TaxID=798079 RepID=A0A9W9CJA1_9PLEO|nr:hypothetical protein N0V83_008872 [Neocucurbitaria cava]
MAAYGVAAPPQVQTMKAMVVLVSQRILLTHAVATAAEVAAEIPDATEHLATSAGLMIEQTTKEAPMLDSSPMGNHRRSDAMDASRSGGSLIARMTKDGQPLMSQPKRSLADRITRDDDGDEMSGRLKGDDRDPRVSDFSEPTRPRGLAERISRDTEINIRGRGRSQEGINIRGTASNNGAAGGINIRGVANGA